VSSAASEPALIGLDWGTTSLRVYLIGSDGQVLDHRESREGILQVPGGDFAGTLAARLADRWRGDLPIVASGMITSRNGWIETPYVDLPAGGAELAAGLVRHAIPGGPVVHFVPGLATEHDGVPDVMRGEETEIVGAVAGGFGDGLYVMPGTHSKWVMVRDRKLTAYATFMTGEIFAALKDHTILGRLMHDADIFQDDAFARGVEASRTSGTEVLHRLFSVRTLPLFGRLAPEEASDFMSGLLYGAEIAAGQARFEAGSGATVVGSRELSARVRRALELCGIEAQIAPADCAARGLFEIAAAAGLVGRHA
jgi:2-dehydro-3-deoxygalactonokinase